MKKPFRIGVLVLLFSFNIVAFMNCTKFQVPADLDNGSSSLNPSPRPSSALSPAPSPNPSQQADPSQAPGPSEPPLPSPPADQAFCGTAVCVSPTTPKTRVTFQSIGIELPVTGDSNHNAAAEVRYRKQGDTGWKTALPLVRIDYTSPNSLVTNALNGSIFSLEPGTSYQLHLIVRDPDGGIKNFDLTATTRSYPVKPTTGRTLHVRPGAGTGDGSSGNPFKSIAEADSAAQPGDRILLHAGTYAPSTGVIEFNKSGTSNQYILYQAAGDGEVTFLHTDIYASYIWLEGITFRNQPFALVGKRNIAEKDVVIAKCSFQNNHYSIHFQGGSLAAGWWIVDNTIDGDNKTMNGSFDGEGIEINMTHDHIVENNTITHVADGISYPGANVDIFNNDIHDVTDDLIECDNGLANVRIVGNRVHNGNNNGFSFQPQESGPWYFLRNQMIGIREGYIKYRQTDRFVFLHNTIVGWDHLDLHNEDSWVQGANNLTSAIAKNNLFIIATSGKVLAFANYPDVRFNWKSELDYNGYEWGSENYPFRYANISYPGIAEFSAATGMESHGVRVQRSECFADLGITGAVPTPIAPVRLLLKSNCQAIDKGVRLPNINDGFTGAGADLGAFEFGVTPPVIGARP